MFINHFMSVRNLFKQSICSNGLDDFGFIYYGILEVNIPELLLQSWLYTSHKVRMLLRRQSIAH